MYVCGVNVPAYMYETCTLYELPDQLLSFRRIFLHKAKTLRRLQQHLNGAREGRHYVYVVVYWMRDDLKSRKLFTRTSGEDSGTTHKQRHTYGGSWR